MAKKITYKIDLNDLGDLSDLSKSEISQAKREVGQIAVEEILRFVSESKSPVSKESWKKTLSKEYRAQKKKKGGAPVADMDLTGNMLTALRAKPGKGDTVEVGIFTKSETGKADGHNNFSGDSKLPRRRFIPEEDQKFKRSIVKEMKKVLEELGDGDD